MNWAGRHDRGMLTLQPTSTSDHPVCNWKDSLATAAKLSFQLHSDRCYWIGTLCSPPFHSPFTRIFTLNP